MLVAHVGRVVHGSCSQIRAVKARHADLPRTVTAIPPDLVPLLAARPGQVVANSEVLNGHPAGLPHHDAISCREILQRGAGRTRRGSLPVTAVNDHAGPAETTDMQ